MFQFVFNRKQRACKPSISREVRDAIRSLNKGDSVTIMGLSFEVVVLVVKTYEKKYSISLEGHKLLYDRTIPSAPIITRADFCRSLNSVNTIDYVDAQNTRWFRIRKNIMYAGGLTITVCRPSSGRPYCPRPCGKLFYNRA